MMMNPDKCHAILKKYALGISEIAEKMCNKQVDAIKLSSPFAGMGFISSEQYSEFVLPYEKIINEAVRKRGKHVYTHTCGSIGDRLEIMRDSKTSGLECLDPPPIGNVDLANAFDGLERTCSLKEISTLSTLCCLLMIKRLSMML